MYLPHQIQKNDHNKRYKKLSFSKSKFKESQYGYCQYPFRKQFWIILKLFSSYLMICKVNAVVRISTLNLIWFLWPSCLCACFIFVMCRPYWQIGLPLISSHPYQKETLIVFYFIKKFSSVIINSREKKIICWCKFWFCFCHVGYYCEHTSVIDKNFNLFEYACPNQFTSGWGV